MNFELSKPQQLLRETTRASLSKVCPKKRVRELMLTDTAFDADLWQTATDQGWVSLHLPEQFGGLGLGLVELAVVAEETSRASLPGPFLPTVWAATLLSRLGNPALTSPYLNSIAEGKFKVTVALLEPETGWNPEDVQLHLEKTNGAWQLIGRKTFVLDAEIADVILFVVRQGQDLAVVAVPRRTPGMTIKATPALDATRTLYDVAVQDVLITGAQV